MKNRFIRTTSKNEVINLRLSLYTLLCKSIFGVVNMVGVKKLVVKKDELKNIVTELLSKYDNVLVKRREELQKDYVEVRAWK